MINLIEEVEATKVNWILHKNLSLIIAYNYVRNSLNFTNKKEICHLHKTSKSIAIISMCQIN